MKYFVCADPHGFTSIMKRDLHAVGFEETNPDHKLVICGDIFDRGKEPVEMYEYLKGLGDQFIFVKGNHEDLFHDAFIEYEYSGRVAGHNGVHYYNGTADTIYAFAEIGFDKLKEVDRWIDNKSVNFLETDHYIFVHGWIPCTIYDKMFNPLTKEYRPDWRNFYAGWYKARWDNGMKMWKRGIVEPGKTIVCGHYHCGFGNLFYHEEGMVGGDVKNEEYYLSDHPFIDDGIIALDSCTVLNEKINVVVLEDNYPGIQKIMENRVYDSYDEEEEKAY